MCHPRDVQMTGNEPSERPYILNEVRSLVRRNKDITSAGLVTEKIDEFESRIETGIHYNIPYPRPINVIPGCTGKDPQVITPIYLHSYRQGIAAPYVRKRANSAPVYED